MKLIAHLHRKPNVSYIEDIYTEYELGCFSTDDIMKLPDTVHVCSHVLLNTIGIYIQAGKLNHKDFSVDWIKMDDDSLQTAHYDEEGYLTDNWQIGYFHSFPILE